MERRSPLARFVGTADAAEMLGVSVSTVKRWVDEQVLPAYRTAGGHRKLMRSEVLALARRVRLSDGSGLLSQAVADDLSAVRDELTERLLQGSAADVRQLLRRAYQSGVSIETMGDQLIAPVMHTVGHQWQAQKIDVWHEHRASQVMVSALHDLGADLDLRAEPDRPLAVGGAPPGDPYQIPSLLIELVLLDAGWQVVNLGPNTPVESFSQALYDLRPRLMWMSASHLGDPDAFVGSFRRLYMEAEQSQTALAVGGAAMTESLRSQLTYSLFGHRLTDLAAFARTLNPRPHRPKRGRPRKAA